MAEQLINEFTVNRPIDEAWPIITNVEKIAPCLPGAELQQIAQSDEHGETYSGVVKVKLGAISTQFKGDAYFVERDDANYRAVLKGSGRDTGGRGNATADITAQAESLSPTSTRCVVTTDLHITGKVAQFGRGILGDVSTKLIDQFAANLNTLIDEEGVVAAAPETASSDAAVAASTAAPRNEEPAAATSASATVTEPKVRKINGPAAEPIDLMGVSGSSVAKRVAPALLGLLLALLILRRRRS
jgi:uncharacterized protein